MLHAVTLQRASFGQLYHRLAFRSGTCLPRHVIDIATYTAYDISLTSASYRMPKRPSNNAYVSSPVALRIAYTRVWSGFFSTRSRSLDCFDCRHNS